MKIKQLLGTPTDVFKLSGELITIGINTASKDQLKSLPGIGDTYAQKIIDGRPYTKKDQLVSKKIVPEGAYDEITDWIIAKQPKK